MALFRFIFHLFVFIGVLAAGIFVLALVILLRTPLLLITVVLACGLFASVLSQLKK